jgi:protoporphyrinogen oxidase
MKIGIIGGGLTGLVAAHAAGTEHEVEVFEKMPFFGGCLSSYRINDYWIERYYHHCFSGDKFLFALLAGLGLSDRLHWHTGTTGYYSRDTIYPLSTPAQILRYPELSLFNKARISWLTVNAKKIDLAPLDDIPAEVYIRKRLGDQTYHSFFEPLLKSKFGERRNEVSAAWLISRIAIRSNRGVSGESLGYIDGGFHLLIEALERSITAKGGKLHPNCPVTAITRKNGGWEVNGTRFDALISTIPPQEIGRLCDLAMPVVPYQGAACMTLGLGKDVCSGVYWLNMKDTAPYGAVVAHTNFIPKEHYGEHIVYLASYFTRDLPPRLDARMVANFQERFGVSDADIHWRRMAVDPWAGPVYMTGYRSLIPACEKHGIFLAGMFSQENYPERSMEGSVRAGHAVVACLDKRMNNDRT